jgi:hypothetical protein
VKNPSQKNRADGVAQGEAPEFKPQYWRRGAGGGGVKKERKEKKPELKMGKRSDQTPHQRRYTDGK